MTSWDDRRATPKAGDELEYFFILLQTFQVYRASRSLGVATPPSHIGPVLHCASLRPFIVKLKLSRQIISPEIGNTKEWHEHVHCRAVL